MIPQTISRLCFDWKIALCPIWFGNWLASVFSIVLFCHFLRNVSRDLEDAARLDGFGPLRIYWHIVLPLVGPAFLFIAVFVFMATWSVFLAPLLTLSNSYLPAISQLQPAQPAEVNLWILTVASLLVTLPVIVIFFFARRYLLHDQRTETPTVK